MGPSGMMEGGMLSVIGRELAGWKRGECFIIVANG